MLAPSTEIKKIEDGNIVYLNSRRHHCSYFTVAILTGLSNVLLELSGKIRGIESHITVIWAGHYIRLPRGKILMGKSALNYRDSTRKNISKCRCLIV